MVQGKNYTGAGRMIGQFLPSKVTGRALEVAFVTIACIRPPKNNRYAK
jgi:hypothetical protein